MKNILNKKEMDDIQNWCELFDITEYEVNNDGSIDVLEDVFIQNILPTNMTSLPIKFNVIHGDFTVDDTHITNYKNMPEIVHGDFTTTNNALTNIVGCPKKIQGNMNISDNSISSFYVGEYDVQIGGNIIIANNWTEESILHAIILDETEEYFEEDDFDEYMTNLQYDHEKLKLIFKYQRHFEIWNKDLSLNEKNFQELMDEINDGLK